MNIHLAVPDDLGEEIGRRADEQNRTIAGYVRHAIIEQLKRDKVLDGLLAQMAIQEEEFRARSK